MKPYWETSVFITATRTESGYIKFSIDMGLTGPMLVMRIGDERVVLATRWQEYTSEHGNKQLIDAITEGVKQLKELKL